jgi:hypothetical protein
MDTNKNQMSESEEVISPEVRVGPAEKEKHSVSMKKCCQVFFPHRIRTPVYIFVYFFRIIFLPSMQICGIMFASGMKMPINSISMIYMEDKKALLSV